MDTRRFIRRAALRGALAASAAAAVSRRRGSRGVAASSGLAVGAAFELPAAGIPGLLVAAALHRSARTTAAAAATGALAGLATTRVWPVAPRTPAQIRPALTPIDTEPSIDGEGLAIVVNQDAGSPFRANPAEHLREQLPAARVIEATSEAMPDAVREAAEVGRALGVAGGDGSISAAAAVAHALDRPLLVVPAGTLNHLARDLGLADPDDALRALRQGHTVAVDVATIDGRAFLNTASFGAYGDLVDARERLEHRIGKWPAMVVALASVLRRARPIDVELDGRPRRLWMIFIGNCRYHPAGFAPTWRERLDDGRLDIRLVDATAPWARTRLLLAILTGRLGRSRVYEAFTTTSLHVRAINPEVTLRLARDGETFDGSAAFEVCKAQRPLAVYVPRPDDGAGRGPSEPSESAGSLWSRRRRRPTTNSSATSATTPMLVTHGPADL